MFWGLGICVSHHLCTSSFCSYIGMLYLAAIVSAVMLILIFLRIASVPTACHLCATSCANFWDGFKFLDAEVEVLC